MSSLYELIFRTCTPAIGHYR